MASETIQTSPVIDYQSVLLGMTNPYVLYEIICDTRNSPIDLRFLDMNPAFAAMVGLIREELIGRRVLETLPDTEGAWIERYARVGLTGQADRLVRHAVDSATHLDVAAFCPRPGQVAVTFNDISAQITAQQEQERQARLLQSVEFELKATYQSAPVSMLVLDSRRKVVKINPAALEFFRRNEGDALGKRIGELLDCSNAMPGSACGYGARCDSCLIQDAALKALAFGRSTERQQVRFFSTTDEGSEARHLLFSASPLIEGPSARALLCLVDLSNLYKEQQLRRESEELYRTLIEKGDKGVFIHQQGKMVFVNQQFCSLVQRTPEELLDQSCFDLIPPEVRPKVLEYIAEEQSGQLDIPFLRSDGSVFPAETFGASCQYRGADARIVSIRDISESKRAEAELRGSERRYARLYRQFESLLDAISDPIALLTPEYALLWTNKAYEEVRHELGTDDNDLVFAQYFQQGTDYPVEKCLRTGEISESRLTTRDERVWQLRAFPLKDEARAVQQVIAVCVDITENLRLQKETLQSSRMASLGLLAAGVAHEINNPNALVLHNSDLLLKIFQALQPYLDETFRERADLEIAGFSWEELAADLPGLLSAMQGGAQRIKRIVNDLRDFARHEKNNGFEAVDLNQVAVTTAGLVENALKKSSASFRMDLAADLPPVQGSPGRLEQVLINLLLNASQALDAPGQSITLETFYDSAAGQVVAQVVDQGRGIAPEILSSLTEPFITTKGDSGGTGLGLSVAERIVQEHGGQLCFESTPREGTSVAVRLPAIWEENHG